MQKSITESQKMVFATVARNDLVDFDNPNSVRTSHPGVMDSMISKIKRERSQAHPKSRVNHSQQPMPHDQDRNKNDSDDDVPSIHSLPRLDTANRRSPKSRESSERSGRSGRSSRSSRKSGSRSRSARKSRESQRDAESQSIVSRSRHYAKPPHSRRRSHADSWGGRGGHRSRVRSSALGGADDSQVRQFYVDKMRELGGANFNEERHMTMDLKDLQFLYTRTKTDTDTRNTVSFMKDIIKFGMSGVEGLNEWAGPVLNLRGWARHATQDMSRYDSALEKIYKRYWRHGSVNPFMELAMLIVGSAVIYHWQNAGSSQADAEYLNPPSATHTPPPSAQRGPAAPRRSMRPPSFTAPAAAPTGGGGDAMSGLVGSMLSGGGGGGGMFANLMPLLKILT